LRVLKLLPAMSRILQSCIALFVGVASPAVLTPSNSNSRCVFRDADADDRPFRRRRILRIRRAGRWSEGDVARVSQQSAGTHVERRIEQGSVRTIEEAVGG
jgi:hypothetical protein